MNIHDLKVDDFLYTNWLRPENVAWDSVASKLISDELLISENIMDMGIGNGYFTFITLGGKFDKAYDWYYNVDTEGFWQNKDIYDSVKVQNISRFIEKKPDKKVKLAVDHKQNLLTQAGQLGFIEKTLCADANDKFSFEGIDTVFSNILYWLDDPFKVLKNLSENLKTGARIIIVFPNPSFYEYCRSYKLESKTWKMLNRGRAECMMWKMGLEEFGNELAKKTDFKIAKATRYLSKRTLQTWDIGFRPFSSPLIKMANNLSSEKRLEVKMEWCDICQPFIYEFLENEIGKGPSEGGFNFVVLSKG